MSSTLEASDKPRLARQLDWVREFMLKMNTWMTLSLIEKATGYPQASISARP